MKSNTPDEIAALRTATREAHETIQELKTATRDARAILEQLRVAVREDVGQRIDDEVKRGLEEYEQALAKAIRDATDAVNRRFDQIRDILLGEDRSSRRRGVPSIPDLARRHVERREDSS